MKLKLTTAILAVFLVISTAFNYKKINFIDPLSLPMNQKFKSDSIDRKRLIINVIGGDGSSAYALGDYYVRNDLPEAGVYWLKIASKLGNKNMDSGTIEAIERSVLDQYRNSESGSK